MAVITVSRQFGAGGKTLAEKLAARLGYEIAHEEIIEKLAEAAHMSTDGIRAFEVEEGGEVQRLSAKKFIGRVFDTSRRYMDGQRYVTLLRQILPQFAVKDRLIILGRGAQFILREHPDTLHVLLLADEPDRIAFMQRTYGLTETEARQAVIKQSKRRRRLLKLFHEEDYDQPLHYDLVLNMSKLEMDHAVELVFTLVPDGEENG